MALMTEPVLPAESVAVPRATYWRLCAIVRLWDAWLLTDQGDDQLRDAAASMTARFAGREEGARIEEPLQIDGTGCAP